MLLSDVGKMLNVACKGDCEFEGFAIDSRAVKKGNMFVCLPGARVDGHDFASKAAENGAACFLCEKPLDTDLPYCLVPDSLKGLQDLGKAYRLSLGTKVVAVTGSVGKTTTKEYISSVLSRKYRTHKTEGNKNSETGVPLTLLAVSPSDEAVVTEMGMSAKGEISVLTKIACPDIAVITNIGVSHIEHLGSQENIMLAKLEILEGLSENGTLIINYDDEYLRHAYNDLLFGKIPQRIIRYGINNRDCDVIASEIAMEDGSLRFCVRTPEGDMTVIMPCEGVHNVYNSLAAISVGVCMGVSLSDMSAGLAEFKGIPLRQQSYKRDGLNIIEDCYNASPSSMQAGIDVLRRKKGRKIAVLGDMLELGDFSDELHRKVGKMLENIDILVAFGHFNGSYVKGAEEAGLKSENCYSCENNEAAAVVLSQIAKDGDHILIKASRGMSGEKIAEKLFEIKEQK